MYLHTQLDTASSGKGGLGGPTSDPFRYLSESDTTSDSGEDGGKGKGKRKAKGKHAPRNSNKKRASVETIYDTEALVGRARSNLIRSTNEIARYVVEFVFLKFS